MEIQVELKNRKRKELAQIVSGITGEEPLYKGAPSYAYTIGKKVTVERDGTIAVAEPLASNAVFLNQLLEGLEFHGFDRWIIKSPKLPELPESLESLEPWESPDDGIFDSSTARTEVGDLAPAALENPAQRSELSGGDGDDGAAAADDVIIVSGSESTQTPLEARSSAEADSLPQGDEPPSDGAPGMEHLPQENKPPSDDPPDSLTVQLPREGFTPIALDNLSRLIDAKSALICKALAVTKLPMEVTEESVSFPWFERELTSEEISAYTCFTTLLADMAKRQSRVLTVAKEVENEKYAFRCFLLRLGMIGEEYSNTRRILLRNLSGNGSMKSNERKPPTATPATMPKTKNPVFARKARSPALATVTRNSAKAKRFTLKRTPKKKTGRGTDKVRFTLKKLLGTLKLW